MTMHTFRDGAPFLLLAEAPPTFRHSLRFFQILHLVPGDYTNLFVTLSPSSFASCGHYLSPRIEIVFLPLSTSVPNFSRLYSFIFLFNTSRSSMYNSHSPTTPVLPSLALPQGHTCASCSSFRPLVYLFFFLAGPGPLHELQFRRLRLVQWVVQMRLHSRLSL